MDYFLSVIIPCFNSGKVFLDYYLQELVYLNDVEFVIVDDCSTDNSFTLLKEHIKKDNFQIIKNDKNGGPGYSRNVGIDASRGKYVTFLDSDDFFTNSFFDRIREETNDNPDLLLFDHIVESNNRRLFDSVFLKKPRVIEIEDLIIFTRGCPWGKVYKNDIVKKQGIRFLNQMRNEDTPFTKTAISFCKRCKYIPEPMYVYRKNPTSITHDNSNVNVENAFNAFNYVSNNINEEYEYCLDAIFAKELFYSVSLTQIRKMEKHEWVDFVDGIVEQRPLFYKSKVYSKLPFRYKIFCHLIRKKKYRCTKTLLRLLRR